MGFLGSIGRIVGGLAAPLIGGGFGFAGQQSTNAANAEQVRQTNDFNAREAEKNRQFQADQSSTEFQRRVKDLEAAGLNPALAYQQGGASAMSGSTASGQSAKFDSSAGAGISSARSAFEAAQSYATQATQRDAVSAQAELSRAQADNTRSLMLANLEEIRARASQHGSAAAYDQTRNIALQQSQKLQLQLLQSEFERNVASAEESRSRRQIYGPQAALLHASLPAARNAAAAADTWFGKNVAPYLNSSESIGRTLGRFIP